MNPNEDNDNIEYSESGSPIIHYNEPKHSFEFAAGNPEEIESITDHVEKHIGKIDKVFHEIVSDLVHIDIHHVKPSGTRDFHALVTSGMSGRSMSTPVGVEENQYAELVFLLPQGWKINENDFNEEDNYWPIRWLKILARFPHEYNTWLSYGHTIPNGDPPEPFAPSINFDTILLLPSFTLGENFFSLQMNDKKVVNFYTLIPLYPEEANFKLKKGLDALLTKFEKNAISDILDTNRTNTCKKQGIWRFFN